MPFWKASLAYLQASVVLYSRTAIDMVTNHVAMVDKIRIYLLLSFFEMKVTPHDSKRLEYGTGLSLEYPKIPTKFWL